MSTITILVPNEVQGLQVFRDDQWFDVKYIPNALVIHIGDQLEILSNGKYKSVLHRTTVNKEKTRMSWPVFLEPPSELAIGPLPKLINGKNPPKWQNIRRRSTVTMSTASLTKFPSKLGSHLSLIFCSNVHFCMRGS